MGLPMNLLPAFYSFEIWDSNSTGVLPGWAGDQGTMDAQVTLRLPPQSLTIEQPFRADLGMDLAGNVVAAEGGYGPGRWSLRGVHGVSQQGLSAAGMMVPWSYGEARQGVGLFNTEGLSKRTDLQNLFLAYAARNKERLKANLAPYRMVVAIRGGPPSEFQNEEWWILPMGMPTDERTAGRPHDWAFSVSFMALNRVTSEYSRPPSIKSIKALIADIKSAIGSVLALVKAVTSAFASLVQDIRDGLSIVSSAINAVQSIQTAVLSDVRSACGLVDQASYQISSMRSLLNTSALRSDVKSQIHASLNQLRVSLGMVNVALRTNISALGSPSVLPPPMPVLSGMDLRRMAAATYGDESKWTLIADKNGMVFPWVAWPDSSGNYPASALIPGAVATLGTAVQGPSLAPGGIIVPDPIGTDIDPNGAVDANGHLALVGGLQNLENALARRLMTPRGYLPQHPDYGSLLSTFKGAAFDVPTLLAIRADVSRTLKQDPRVINVTSVSLTDSAQAGSVSVTANVQTVLGSLVVSTVALTS